MWFVKIFASVFAFAVVRSAFDAPGQILIFFDVFGLGFRYGIGFLMV